MPRYASNRPGYARSKRWVANEARELLDLPQRDISDPASFKSLHAHACALSEWLDQLAEPMLLRVIATTTGPDELSLLLTEIGNQYRQLAPALKPVRQRSSPRTGNAADENTMAISEALNLMAQLPEFNLGNTDWVPEPTAALTASARVHAQSVLEWSPPDEHVDAYVRGALERSINFDRETLKHKSLKQECRRMHSLASAAAKDLIRQVRRRGEGGLNIAAVGRAVSASKSAAIQLTHDDFVRALADLEELFEADNSLASMRWPQYGKRLHDAAVAWSRDCLPYLKLSRQSRQSKRKVLQRAVANVLQYAYLIEGTTTTTNLRRVILTLYAAVSRIRSGLFAINPVLTKKASVSARDKKRHFRQWDTLLVAPEALRDWRHRLGDATDACGRLIASVSGDDGQSEPWLIHEKLPSLRKARVATRRGRGAVEQVTDLLVRMQAVGLAFEVPMDFIEGTTLAPKKQAGGLLHTGRKWLVNPLGRLLRTPR
jgi:hypothetical protein